MHSYERAQKKLSELYNKKYDWNRMSLVNIANSGLFSSDRTIQEYVRDIWFKGCGINE